MLSSREALDHVLRNTRRKKTARIPLKESQGLILAQDVTATIDLPGFNNSAMDGFALRACDLSHASCLVPVTLNVKGTVGAGSVFSAKILEGECVEIMTGAPLPKGTDTVVMKEDVILNGKKALFKESTVPGDNVRFRGEDIKSGQKVLEEGQLIGAAQIALLAAQGIDKVWAIPRPTVGIVVTGDELVAPGKGLRPGKIYNSNSFMLEALVREAGSVPHFVGIARDTRKAIAQKIRKALAYDVAVISGGVSVGTFDYVKDVLRQMGLREIFWKVKIKPGKPLYFGKKGSQLVFGVPGNPVSAFVIFQEFIKPALRTLMGWAVVEDRIETAVLTQNVSKKPGRATYIRAICEHSNGIRTVRPAGAQGSHSLKSLVRANALMILPAEGSHFKAGDKVPIKSMGSSLEFAL